MLTTIITILILAAFGGSYLLTYILMEKKTPKVIAMIHGLAAATGVVLLIIYSIYYQPYWISVAILILAAIGGLYMLSQNILGKKFPKFLAVGHGAIAIIGILSLLFFIYSKTW